MSPIPNSNIVRRWFAGLIEQSFETQVGLCDPLLLDYLVDLLTDFMHVERINMLHDSSGRRVEDLAEMLTEAELGASAGVEARRRQIHRHIGDFTLFWTGLYPENLRRMHRRQTRDDLLSYFERGKRSYAIASGLSDEKTAPPAGLLRRLSDEFEYCVYGLGLVRRSWEQIGPDSGSTAIWS